MAFNSASHCCNSNGAVKLLLFAGIICQCISVAHAVLPSFGNYFSNATPKLKNNNEYKFQKLMHLNGPTEAFYTYLSVCSKTGTEFDVVNEKHCPDGWHQVALGRYRNAVMETGWGILEIETFAGNYGYETQAYAAGLAEGILTRKQIYYHYRNTVEGKCEKQKEYCKRLYNYLKKNLEYIQRMIKANIPLGDEQLWFQVQLIFYQLTGINNGYSEESGYKRNISFEINAIYALQLSGELLDLDKYLNKTSKRSGDPESGHCTGLVKLAADNRDIFFSHVAMSGYNTMNRILKFYSFDFDSHKVPGHQISMSSYPATIASVDDYILTSAGLGSIETTIGIFNESLYSSKYMTPMSLHCWIRSVVASRLAHTAEEWVKIFARYNSGTYNNQWSVVDFKLFTPKKELPDSDVLWVLEQIPGFTMYKDMTWFLKKYTYWASYNIPYFQRISDLSGFSEEGKKQKWRSWSKCPRAKIVARDHHKVTDLDTLAKLMRYNDYTHDPFSRCKCIPPYSAEAGMSARGDLNPANGTYEFSGMGHRNHGGIDYKGTNYEMFKKLRFIAWGGPTYDPLPVFSWLTTDIVTNHYGQPDVWNFTAIETPWETNVQNSV